MSTQHAILGILESSPRHGYDIKRLWDERFSHLKPLRFSQIYASLARLERDGRVELVGQHAGKGPDRKTYALTTTGAEDLAAWLTEPEEPQAPIQSTLFLKVVLALSSDRPAESMLEAQHRAHTDRMRELLAMRDDANDVDTALLDFAVFHLEADLRWIDHVAHNLSQLRSTLARA